MKWIILVLCLAAFAMAEGGVFELTDDNFDSTIRDHHIVMVKFFAPWCGHCKSLAPEYEKVAQKVKDENKDFVIAELDATKHTKAAGKFEIKGYPTLKLFIDGNPINYEGERKADPIFDFIEKKIVSPSINLKAASDVKARVDSKGRKCILVSNDKEALKTFEAVGRVVEEFKFYHTSEETGKESFPEITKFPSVVVLRDFEEKKLIYASALTELEAFLRKHQLPVVSVLDKEVVKMLFEKGDKKGLLFMYAPGQEGTAKEEFTKFAAANKAPNLLFVEVNAKDGDWGQRLLPYFGIDEKELPVVEVLAVVNSEPHRYRHTGKIELEDLNSFLADYKEDKIVRFMKSEPVPEKNPGPVFTVVGKSFKAEVMDNDMDVLVKFYATWCGHCKTLAPIYVEVAKALEHNKKLKLVEVEATKNDIQGMNIQGFPTVKLFAAGHKDAPVDLSGDRTKEGIIKFLKEKCTNPISEQKTEF